MRRWEDVLPPEIAKEQTAWERYTQLLRLLECGVEKQELRIIAGNVSSAFLNHMLRMARRRPIPPIDAWLKDNEPIQELARKLKAKARRDGRMSRGGRAARATITDRNFIAQRPPMKRGKPSNKLLHQKYSSKTP